jgi:hypothetical protein
MAATINSRFESARGRARLPVEPAPVEIETVFIAARYSLAASGEASARR